jgi:hypothetical protein
MGIRNLFKRRVERREHVRRAIIETAWMRIDGEPVPYVCVIWDISECGARVAVANPQAVSDEITLLLKRDATYGTRCRVAWRMVDQIGLAFIENGQAILRCIEEGAVPVDWVAAPVKPEAMQCMEHEANGREPGEDHGPANRWSTSGNDNLQYEFYGQGWFRLNAERL